MKPCMLCGKMTKGSVGKAGIRWSRVCQPCKDIEDSYLAARIFTQAKAIQTIVDLVQKARRQN